MQYHPVIHQILQILPNIQETQQEVWSCTTKDGHNNTWRALCVDLIGPYTLKGRNDGKSIDFMCLTMIDPARSWFEIVKLPTVIKLNVPSTGKGKKVTCNNYTKEVDTTFDKSSKQISNLVYKIWFSRHPSCQYLIYDNGSKLKLHFRSMQYTQH